MANIEVSKAEVVASPLVHVDLIFDVVLLPHIEGEVALGDSTLVDLVANLANKPLEGLDRSDMAHAAEVLSACVDKLNDEGLAEFFSTEMDAFTRVANYLDLSAKVPAAEVVDIEHSLHRVDELNSKDFDPSERIDKRVNDLFTDFVDATMGGESQKIVQLLEPLQEFFFGVHAALDDYLSRCKTSSDFSRILHNFGGYGVFFDSLELFEGDVDPTLQEKCAFLHELCAVVHAYASFVRDIKLKEDVGVPLGDKVEGASAALHEDLRSILDDFEPNTESFEETPPSSFEFAQAFYAMELDADMFAVWSRMNARPAELVRMAREEGVDLKKWMEELYGEE